MNPIPTGETLEQAVRLAGRAPSLHNTQPWRWVFDGTVLRLYSVPHRLLPSTDVSGRQMLISCGIALGHLRSALAATGVRIHVAYFPDPGRRDHLATLRFERTGIVTDADRDRAAAITRRHTDRLPFEPPRDWADFEIVLRSIVEPRCATLVTLGEDARPELAHASRLTAALRRYDSAYQAEMRWWTGHSNTAAGIPPSALVSPEEHARVEVGRALPTVAAASRRTEITVDRSVVLVLATAGDSAPELVRCGEALSTVLLECTVAGYATCPLTHVTELPRSRAVVRTLIGGRDLPQVLVRVGAAPDSAEPPANTPRLPLPDILEYTPAHGRS